MPYCIYAGSSIVKLYTNKGDGAFQQFVPVCAEYAVCLIQYGIDVNGC